MLIRSRIIRPATIPLARDEIMLKAVLFDLHGTLGYVDNPVAPTEVVKILEAKGYEVSPQAWEAAIRFVGIIDFPKFKFDNEISFLRHVCYRLGIEIDTNTLNKLVKLFQTREHYKVYPDATEAVRIAKEELDLKVAIVTTIPKFKFMQVIETLSRYLDLIMTGSEAGCDKSNPKMYLSILEALKLAPEEAIVIGDEEYVDIILPKKIGMKAIQIIRDGTEKCELADAHVNNLIEAMRIIKKWIRRSRK